MSIFVTYIVWCELHVYPLQQSDVWRRLKGKIPSWEDSIIQASSTPWGRAVYPNIALPETRSPNVWPGQPRMADGSTRTDFFLAKFGERLRVPRSGYWTFYLGVNDAAYLLIDGQKVAENRCCHMLQETSGTHPLTAGTYSIEVKNRRFMFRSKICFFIYLCPVPNLR